MLDRKTLERLLGKALARGGDYADVFCERRVALSFRLQGGVIHEGGLVVTQGVGIRTIAGESAGYGYSDDLSAAALARAAGVA
ncbi:MAG: PmbA/TldA family metallopeptidase, partial [Vulcanimicrobiaceae bacterium]